MHKFLRVAAALSFPVGARAQQPAQVEPDQRDFTSGTDVVSRFQLESSSFSSQRGPREYRLAETLLRVPVTKSAEIRATVPPYIVDRDLGLNGLDDANLEARIALGQAKTTKFALTLGSTLPTGKRGLAERRYQPQAVFAANFELGEKTELLANLGIARPTDEGNRFTQSIAAVSLRHDVSPQLNLFGEVYGFNRLEANGDSQKFAALGLVFRLQPRTAVFGRAVTGVSNDTDGPDREFQVGLARLF